MRRAGPAGWKISDSSSRSRPPIRPCPPSQDIVDPVAARDLLQQVIVEAGYGDAAVTACRPNVVRYKPGSRCTVVVDVDYDQRQRQPARP